MSTKTTSTQDQKQTNTLNYDPTSLANYKALQGPLLRNLQNYMQNPLQSSFFANRVGMGNQFISQSQAGNTRSFLQNFKNQGFTGATPSAFTQSGLQNIGRQTSSLKAGNFLNQLFNANSMQLQATGMSQAYQPLLTGSSTVGHSTGTQTTSGTGTWLPQVIGGALGGVTSALTGGLTGAAKSSGGGGSSFGGGLNTSGLVNPFAGAPGSGIWSNPSPLSGSNPFNPAAFSSLGGH